MESKAVTNPYLQFQVPRKRVCIIIAGLCLTMAPAYGSSRCDTDTAACIVDVAALDPQQQEPLTGQVQAPPPLPPSPAKPEFEIYGFAMLDMGYDFGQIDPAWFDVERPTKLPAFVNEFGQNGNFWAGVRQTRFGVESVVPTQYGD